MPPAAVARLRWAALNGMRDPRYATVLGQYNLQGKISDSQMEAGRRYSRLRTLLQWAMQSPTIKAQALERLGKAKESDPDSSEGGEQCQRMISVIVAYRDAEMALHSVGGSSVEKYTRLLCEGIGESPPGLIAFNFSLDGLNILVDHWKIK